MLSRKRYIVQTCGILLAIILSGVVMAINFVDFDVADTNSTRIQEPPKETVFDESSVVATPSYQSSLTYPYYAG